MAHVIYDEDPRVKVNGVVYACTMGEGHGPFDKLYGGYGPIYVWVAVCDRDYVAPPHVSNACNEAYDLAMEAQALEFAAGWDPNP